MQVGFTGFVDRCNGYFVVPMGARDQGLELNYTGNPLEYSIEMRLSVSNAWPWTNIVDFSDGSREFALYIYRNDVHFFGYQGPNLNNVPSDTSVHFIITREASSGLLTGFVGGAQIWQFDDFNACRACVTNNAIRFLIDNGVENGPGKVDFIRFYDTVFAPTEVTYLSNGQCNSPSDQPSESISPTGSSRPYSSLAPSASLAPSPQPST